MIYITFQKKIFPLINLNDNAVKKLIIKFDRFCQILKISPTKLVKIRYLPNWQLCHNKKFVGKKFQNFGKFCGKNAKIWQHLPNFVSFVVKIVNI